jgi:hypothetical protein
MLLNRRSQHDSQQTDHLPGQCSGDPTFRFGPLTKRDRHEPSRRPRGGPVLRTGQQGTHDVCFGLAVGYLVYGAQELLGYPHRPDAKVDLATGIWGVWMPGLMQVIAGVILFVGLAWFGSFAESPPLYMAALAFTAYGGLAAVPHGGSGAQLRRGLPPDRVAGTTGR